jgi:hypothetical protein
MPTTTFLQNLGCKVIRCPAHCCPPHPNVVLRHEHCSKSKIADLDIHATVQKQIPSLQIAVNNVTIMQVFNGAAYLNKPASDLGHGEVRSFAQGIGQRAVLAQLEDNVSVFLEGKGAVELDNVGVVKFRVELKFGDELSTPR